MGDRKEGKKLFAMADVLPSQLNAMVKNAMKQTGQDSNEAVRLFNSGTYILVKSSDPLEWDEPIGPSFSIEELEMAIRNRCWDMPEEKIWRLPTIKELEQGLKSSNCGFEQNIFYYSSTPEGRNLNLGNEVMKIRVGYVCLSDSNSQFEYGLHVRLCRARTKK